MLTADIADRPVATQPSQHDQKVLTGIFFVLQTGIPWEYLPQEMGCGSGMTCWRRLREWQEPGVWQRLHELLLAKLNEAGRIDWSRAAIDSSHVRAFEEAPKPGRARSTAHALGADNRVGVGDLGHRRVATPLARVTQRLRTRAPR